MGIHRSNVANLVALALSVVFCLVGCAGVEFVDTNGNKTHGFQYYPAKPYLVIESSDKGSTIKLLSLPDLTSPQYVNHVAGWGTAEFGFDTSHGMLTKFNAKSDSKASETLTAIASLGTANAAIMTAEAAKITARSAVGDKSVAAKANADGSFPHPVLPINKAWTDLQNNVLTPLASPMGNDLTAIQASISLIFQSLGTLKTVDYDPTSPNGLDDLVLKIAAIKKNTKPIYALLVEQRSNLEDFVNANDAPIADKPKARSAARGLDGVIGTLASFLQTTASVELYEILNVGGNIKLRKVQFTP